MVILRRTAVAALALTLALAGSAPDAAAAAAGPAPTPPAVALAAAPAAAAPAAPAPAGWMWPLPAFRVVLPYEAPAHRYGPGHRGIDLRPTGADEVRAPAAGVVAFSGTVVDRPLVTIDHGDGLVTTLEPVTGAPAVGTELAAGDPVGIVARGGHAPAGTVHFGVRRDGEYINPMLLLERIPRAVLLPCC